MKTMVTAASPKIYKFEEGIFDTEFSKQENSE